MRCESGGAHLVDSLDCPSGTGWVCRWEWWPGSLLGSLQTNTQTFHTTFLKKKKEKKTPRKPRQADPRGGVWVGAAGAQMVTITQTSASVTQLVQRARDPGEKTPRPQERRRRRI